MVNPNTKAIQMAFQNGLDVGLSFSQSYLQTGDYVYILKLESDKYYVGCTNNLNRRLSEHWCGKGALWTKKYPPVGLLVLQPGTESDEKRLTIKLMRQQGFECVRGSHWTSVKLQRPSFMDEESDEDDKEGSDDEGSRYSDTIMCA